jgi:hypothetical protein
MNPFLSIFTEVPELQVCLREYAQDARHAFAENTILAMEPIVAGKPRLLLDEAPLRTVHAAFTAHGSSI